ncbi:MAG: peptidylprolyl isomerase [Oscillospiraceae bacterium]|nr:peptidylprolyl isomerase [Oscillospiraceae bacterium]
METKNLTVKIVLVLLICSLGLFSFTGCKKSGEPQGNMKSISSLKPGDTYAVVKFNGFEEELTFILFDTIAPTAIAEFRAAANSGYYDGKTIHRVLKDILIQGGALNIDGSDNTIPPEEMFDIETHDNARNFFGALCYAGNPESNMNYRQFFVVTANTPVDIEMQIQELKDVLEQAQEGDFSSEEKNEYELLLKDLMSIPTAVKERYAERGGLPSLDGTVTVFGQLISGWELLEKISAVEVVAGNAIDDNNNILSGGKGQNSRPAENVFIESIKIITIETEDSEDK